MNEQNLAEIRELISRDNIPGAFQKLKSFELDQELSQSLTALEAKLNSLNRQVRMGTISYSESSVEKSRIVYGLIGLLDEIKSGVANPVNTPPVQKTVSQQNAGNGSADQGKTKILFLASNPGKTGQLRLDKEYREIDEGLRRAARRERFELQSRWAVRSQDLTRAMLEENPQIIHFSGHGIKSDGGTQVNSQSVDHRGMNYTGKHGDPTDAPDNVSGAIVLEGNDGSPKTVSAEALAGLFELFSDSIQCVFLNACHSKYQSDAIIKHVPYVIGMNQAVPDDVAVAFAVAFYDALGNGRDIEFAFKFAKSSVAVAGLSGNDIPVLVKRNA
ncbi:MAG: CHAT domain-containing protein [Bacteroidia bacterium]